MDSDLFFILLPVAAGFWVYFDAHSHHIGSYRDDAGKMRGCSPVFWGVMTQLVCIITLPVYLIIRKKLLQTAAKHPASSDKSIGILIMAAVGGFILWYFWFRY
ncbi:hypothetical protein ACSBQN_12955 [Morganella sp. B601]|uniref:hypothetical protein n=1 Tax=Morganella sp. B601 TaxID=3444315 RepID=UPI003EBA36B7